MDYQGVIPADRPTQSKIAQPEVEIVVPFTTPFLTTLLFDVRNSWEQASTPTSAWLASSGGVLARGAYPNCGRLECLTSSGRYRFCSSFCWLGSSPGHVTAYDFGGKYMDYALAGLYALLRPEKF
jgi:hypothetical protein